MTGRIDFYFLPVAPALNLINEGKVRALAVSTSKRAAALPNVPTTAEAGLKDAAYVFWNGLFLPAKTPADIVNRLHAETVKALAVASVQERLAKIGQEPLTLSAGGIRAILPRRRARHRQADGGRRGEADGLTGPRSRIVGKNQQRGRVARLDSVPTGDSAESAREIPPVHKVSLPSPVRLARPEVAGHRNCPVWTARVTVFRHLFLRLTSGP